MADDGDEHFSDELLDVVWALRDKDLGPLARYLRSGGLSDQRSDSVAIPEWLATELADMIESDRLRAVGRKYSAEVRQRTHDHLVGRFMEREMSRLGPGSYASAETAAAAKFDRAPSAVAGALKRYRQRRKDRDSR